MTGNVVSGHVVPAGNGIKDVVEKLLNASFVVWHTDQIYNKPHFMPIHGAAGQAGKHRVTNCIPYGATSV